MTQLSNMPDYNLSASDEDNPELKQLQTEVVSSSDSRNEVVD